MPTLTKQQPIRSKKLRNAARGQQCTVNLPGICSYDRDTVVLAHLHDEVFGKGQKADDTSAIHACHTCHTAIDRGTHGLSRADLLEMLLRALQRTIRHLVVSNIIIVPMDKPTVYKPKQRKPKAQRKAIPSRPMRRQPSNTRDVNEDLR